ncbi:TIGR01244 family sulfur transferase [Roseateles amylovorans]|uniref:TIGR01244 family sulfur transferase n=1 Tax=Roseateles amylovorans TaxID=2978473 RepID=A0ABY6ATT3_9BURK|nr:TIGR01244 family sulfur transferase [Roseateles amylovorans]UXH76343.1 TIGR01244 family sulfur transferase [Roseateles amylovorans]
MELTVQQLTPDFCVAPQLAPEVMTALAGAGFKSVINNRPDFEGGPDQPTSAQMQQAAEAAGLAYRHLPVQGGYQSPEEIAAMQTLLAELPKPVLAFCRSGARSTKLFAAASQL